MEKRAASEIMLIFMLLGMLMVAFSIQLVKAQSATRKAGVNAGYWIKYELSATWDSNDPDATTPQYILDSQQLAYFSNVVQSVSGTNITFNSIKHFQNGTEKSETRWIDVDSGHAGTGSASGYLSFIAANLSAGDLIYTGLGAGIGQINETITRTYLGQPVEINHHNSTTSGTSYFIYSDAYWNRATGVLYEWYMNHTKYTTKGEETYVTQETQWLYPIGIIGVAKTWTVDDDGSADFHTIQEAVNAASDGDTILVRAGTYYEEVLIKGKSISLIGEDPSTTLIDRMLGGIPIEVRIAERVNITGFTVMNSGEQWRSNMIFEDWPESGILLWNSDECNVHGNIVKYNYYGVTIYSSWPESKYNTVRDNLIANNSAAGIFLEGHVETGLVYSETTIIENTITNNWAGLYSYLHSDNRICHNSFINNTLQTLLTTGDTHIWDDGYPSGGNYWSDYTGVDANMDGIGDSFYEIDSNNIDHYPLMGMFSNFNATSEYHVQTICNSSISDFQFNGTAISFNVTGETDTIGFCRICIPTALMNVTYKVYVNGTEVSYDLLPCSNSTHSYLYFTYNHSTQEVVIIPEFPTWTSMLLILILLSIAIAIYKRRLLKTPIH